jgi:hypothetical protein
MPGTRPHQGLEEIHTVQLERPKGTIDRLLRLQLPEVALNGLSKVMRAGAQGRGRKRYWTLSKRTT